jgi:hypothetical protein
MLVVKTLLNAIPVVTDFVMDQNRECAKMV